LYEEDDVITRYIKIDLLLFDTSSRFNITLDSRNCSNLSPIKLETMISLNGRRKDTRAVLMFLAFVGPGHFERLRAADPANPSEKIFRFFAAVSSVPTAEAVEAAQNMMPVIVNEMP
jgi:hypothetical protein